MKTDVVRNWDFGKKNSARDLALSVAKKMVKTALFFPSDTCFDLIQSLKKGLITRRTFLIIVEREPAVIKEIKKFLKKVGFKNYYIHSHKAGVHKLNLTEVLKGKKLDFMFFDICGNLTPEVAYWFYNNQSNFARNMMMPTTLAIHPRGKRAKTRGRQKETGRFCTFFHVLNRETADFDYDDTIYAKRDNLAACNADSIYLLRDYRLTCKALYHIFSTRNIVIEETMIYRETDESKTNMAMLNIRLGSDKENDDTFESIIEAYDNKVSNQKKLRKVRQPRKKRRKNRKPARIVLVKMADVAKYKTYDNLPDNIKALITKQAHANNANVKMTHAGYKARLSKLANQAA